MNYNIFFTADMHFGHENMISFVDYNGQKVRPFNTCEECDELMIENWNSMVKPQDKIYVLGDVCFNKNLGDKIMPRLNGKKCLIRGNHDNFKLSWYALWFYDVRGCHNLENYLLTHIPVHLDSKARFKMNVHGHLHRNIVYKNENEIKVPDVWYRNVCMDYNNYKPIPFEQIQHEFSVYKQQGKIIIPKKGEL